MNINDIFGRQSSHDKNNKEQEGHKKVKFSSRYAITFGEVSIVHIGSEQFGKMAQHGYSLEELRHIQDDMSKVYGIDAKFINLSDKLPQKDRKGNEASVLYLPQAAEYMLGEGSANKLFQQQEQIKYDRKFFDNRRKKTLNKQARFNIVFGQQQRIASEDYKQYSVKAFKDLKYLNMFRHELGRHFGQKATNLNAEGNHYYNEKSGIGFHGDSERKIVICLNLGKSSTLRYYWRTPNSSQNKYGPIDLTVNHGDVYIMSQKASGNDWRLRSKFRLVHAAGSDKYIGKLKQ